MAKGLDGDWDRASALVAAARQKGATDSDVPSALAAGVRKWDAPPVLAIDEPKDGATVETREVVLRGHFSSGRPTDRVTVDGKEVIVRDGVYSARISADPKGEDRTVEVAVVDRGAARGTATCKLSFRFPWTASVSAALDLGLGGDWKGAKAKVDAARSAGATDGDFPESLRAGVARYEASLRRAAEEAAPGPHAQGLIRLRREDV